MEFEIGIGGPQGRPLALGFLHPVLAEDALAGVQHRANVGRVEGLAYRDELDLHRVPPGGAGGRGDAGLNGREGGMGHDPESYGRACSPFQGLVLGRPAKARFSR